MSGKKGKDVIELIAPHSILKFKLIERYVSAWANKLANVDNCQGLIYIDCMSNSGYYLNERNEEIEGTAPRVAKVLNRIKYTKGKKTVHAIFNDINEKKVDYLESRLSQLELPNIEIHYFKKDANDCIKEIYESIKEFKDVNVLLVYDPFDAQINWDALAPYFGLWGEVIINHVCSDPVRAFSQVRTEEKKKKYEMTYQMPFETLVSQHWSKQDLQDRVITIIKERAKSIGKKLYVASFPFFTRHNGHLYNLIHVTASKQGFIWFKNSAWKVFDGKSSGKNTHGAENQMRFNFDNTDETEFLMDAPIQNCFCVKDIAQHIYDTFSAQDYVLFSEVKTWLENHPIFPTEGYTRKIIQQMKLLNVEVTRDRYVFRRRAE